MEHQPEKKMVEESAHEPSNVLVLCENSRGFFQIPATNNLCSKCHKDYLLNQSKAAAVVVVEKNDVGGGDLKIRGEEVGGGAEVDQGGSSGSMEIGMTYMFKPKCVCLQF